MSDNEVHITDILSFKQCRRKWNWSSRLRMNLEPSKPHAPFLTGRAVHYAMERRYRDGVDYDQAFTEFMATEPMPEGSREHVDLGYNMMRHYDRWSKRQRGRWSDNSLEFIDMEHKFKIPIRSPSGRNDGEVVLAGKFDGVIRDLTNDEYWLWEVKTARSISDRVATLDIDEQTSAYLLAAGRVLGVPVRGVLYTILKKKLPKAPVPLKNGTLSKALHKDITLDSYLQGIYDYHGYDMPRAAVEAEYGEVLGELVRQPNEFFLRIPVYRSELELAAAEEDIYYAGQEMLNDPPIYLHAGWHCRFCYFKDPCLLYHTPQRDVELATRYHLREEVEEDSELAVED